MDRALLRVFGFRVGAVFCLVCAVLVAVLSGLYLSSNYAIEGYVARQLGRLPWDATVIQQGELGSYENLHHQIQEIPGVDRVETVGLLRLQRGNGNIGVDVNGKPLDTRWIAFVAASDPALLPVDLRRPVPAAEAPAAGAVPANEMSVQAAFVTGGRNGNTQIKIPVGSVLRVYPIRDQDHDDDGDPAEAAEHAHELLAADVPDTLFEARIALPPAQVDRAEFNRLMLERVGALSYLPEDTVVVAVPIASYQHLASVLDGVFLNDEAVHGGDESPPYLPELTHLIKIDQSALIDPWDLSASLRGIEPILRRILESARGVTPFSYANSDLYRLLGHMLQVSQLVGLVTMLVAIPLICLAWVVADLAGGLLIMHERRTIGLTLLRGVPMSAVSRVLNLSLAGGGVAGAVLGLVLGLGLTVLGYRLLGRPFPSAGVFIRDATYLAVVMSAGVIFSLISGRRMVRRFKRMTPLEATARVTSDGVERGPARPSKAYVAAVFIALLLGAYKIFVWITGHSLGTLLAGGGEPVLPPGLRVVGSMGNFAAVPLFLFGAVGLVRIFRSPQYAATFLAVPIAGKLAGFVANHMAQNRRRVMSALFLASLAMAITVLPQVSADSFLNRVTRGVHVALGGDLKLEYNLIDLSGGKNDVAALGQYRTLAAPKQKLIEDSLRRNSKVEEVASIEQYVFPAFYLPDQSDLYLDVVSDRDAYLKTAYFEEALGVVRPFSKSIGGQGDSALTISRGFRQVRSVPLGADVFLDDQDLSLGTRFDNVVAFLPGQPTATVTDREGFANAAVDYLNYLVAADARVIGSAAQFKGTALDKLPVMPSRLVFMVKLPEATTQTDIDRLVAGLPITPDQVLSTMTELPKLAEDMFVALSLENMKVLIVGGTLLAVAGVIALNIGNYLADRRLFSLLRVRGIPPALILRLALAIFLVPVLMGLILGALLGIIAGYGNAQAIWDLPRVYGVAGLLENRLAFSASSPAIIIGMGAILILVSVVIGLWPLRKGALADLNDR